jgi:hypothetical protein
VKNNLNQTILFKYVTKVLSVYRPQIYPAGIQASAEAGTVI